MIWSVADDGYEECVDSSTRLVIEIGTVAKLPEYEEGDLQYTSMWHITYHYDNWKYVEYVDVAELSRGEVRDYAEWMYNYVKRVIPQALSKGDYR